MTMLLLNGNNLRERQQQLNEKVNDAAKEKVDFNKVKHQTEKSDVDKLFKIDLAAKYKNVEYILEILKCGDNLYISRALDKCIWLCDKDLICIMNNEYLSQNLFPWMSIKMRNRVLRTIATYLNKDDERAIGFYTYCMTMKLPNIALKFLIHTPEPYKLDVILHKSKVFNLIAQKEGEYLKYFIGDSFVLAENYIKNLGYEREKSSAIYALRYMYSMSNEKYLNILETCKDDVKTFGRRLSRHIIHNHKERVMMKPLLYANVLNRNIISRNSTIEEAKVFATALLPEKTSSFFMSNYYESNKFVLDLIASEDKFSFIKKIFTEKYPDQAFETCYEFYSSGFYNIMTPQEREDWALRNIASQSEILGNGNDYLWYKFVNFEKALVELKKMIMKTTDKKKRCEMLKVLIYSANNEKELTQLLNYYCDRHKNEIPYVKDSFLRNLVSDYNVWRFGEDCWKALEKVFYSSEVFDKSRHQNCKDEYRVLALMYYILNKKPVLEVLNEYIDSNVICLYTLRKHIKKIDPVDAEKIFQYLLQFYVEKIITLSKMPYKDNMKKEIRRYIRSSLDLAQNYDKTKSDLPEIIHKYIELDRLEFKNHTLLLLANNDQFSSRDIMRYLKEDAEMLVNQFPKIKSYIESRNGNINWLVKRLKIYFSNDISEKYLTLFNECLSADSLSYTTADMAIYGIFILADETSKIEMLTKYTPTEHKIDHSKLSMNTLNIQRAICRKMHYSRPPLPLSNVFQYVIGDYVQYCLVLFRSYLLNLPNLQCLEFIETMINKPVSIQKHGLRLAFECFDVEKLKTVILNSWKKTKNVSMRMILYKSLFKRILNENDDTQMALFEVLIILTLDLNEDDDEIVFQLIHIENLPHHLVGRYLEAAWNTLIKFPEKPQKLERMDKIISHIEHRSLHLFPEDALNKIIDSHVNSMLDERKILKTEFKQGTSMKDLLKSKWNLTVSYLVYMPNEMKFKKNLEIVKHILKLCVEMWNEHDDSKYIIRHFLQSFIDDLDSKSYDEKIYSNVVVMQQTIEQDLKEALPEKEIYMLVWKLRSSILTKKVLMISKLYMDTGEDNDEKVIVEIRKSAILLGTEFGLLIKEYVDQGKFYRIFYEHWETMVSNMISNFHNCLTRSCIPSCTDIRILFCLGLLEYQIIETYMFALKLLPEDYNENKYLDDYINLVTRIQAFQDSELQCYVYEKFVNTDFKPREYISYK